MVSFLKSFLPFLTAVKKFRLELFFASGALITIILSIALFISSSTPTNVSSDLIKVEKPPVMVEVAGAINKPGVYEVSSSARLKEVIDLAGGLSESADTDYFHRNFNLAKIVVDQQKIYVPSIEEQSSDDETNNKQTLININKASLTELDRLPGIGTVTAAKIIDNRPYNSIEELLEKKIVNKNVYEQIKEIVSL